MKKLILTFFPVLLTWIQADAQVDFSKNLIAYYPFNGNADDASGMGNHGIVSGAVLTNDQWGHANSAYYFNGKSDFIRIPNQAVLSPAKQFSVCAKVKMQGFYDGFCYNNVILAKGLDRTYGSYSLRTTTAGLSCAEQDTSIHVYRCDVQYIGSSKVDLDTKPYVVLNNWDCIIGTYDHDTVRVYVNGDFRYQYYEPAKGTNTDDLYIGMLSPWDRPFWFKGVIDEVRLYDRVLNADEIGGYCSADSVKEQTPTASLTGNDRIIGLDLFPNPCSDRITISYTLSHTGTVRISLRDLTGRTLLQQQFTDNSGPGQHSFDLSRFSTGSYLVSIETDHARATERLFIR